KKVPTGYTSGRIFHYLQGASLAAAGLAEKDLNAVPTPNFVEGIKLFMAGRVDAGYIPFNSGIGKQAMVKIPGGWRYLSIGNASDATQKAAAFLPTSRTLQVKPSEKATGVVDDPTVLLQVDIALFAGAHVSDDVVYKVVKTMSASKPDL